jgi:hypothetical protein
VAGQCHSFPYRDRRSAATRARSAWACRSA